MTLIGLMLYFGLLSLISTGGMLLVIPEMHRYVVDVTHWLTPVDFIQMFAVGQTAPDKNALIAGVVGAFIALGALCGPSAIVAFWVADLWERIKDSPWRAMAQCTMAPIVVGLAFSCGFVLATPGSVP